MKATVGFLETHGMTPAMVAIDNMCNAANLCVIQMELNDLYCVCV